MSSILHGGRLKVHIHILFLLAHVLAEGVLVWRVSPREAWRSCTREGLAWRTHHSWVGLARQQTIALELAVRRERYLVCEVLDHAHHVLLKVLGETWRLLGKRCLVLL